MSRREAARTLGISLVTLGAMVRRGDLRSVRVPGTRRVIVPVDEVRRIIEGRAA